MEFQDYAAKETSALFGRLRASQTGATLQQLQAIREAIDAAAQAIETAPEPDREIDELIAGLTAAAYEEARRAGDETRRISQEARRAIDEAEAALAIQVDENARLTAALAKVDAEAALLRNELDTAQERAEAAERDFLATVDAHGELEAALKASDGESRHLAQAKAHLEHELAATRATLEQAIADVDHLRHDVDRQHAERAELERHLTAANAVADERDALAAELERTRGERTVLQQQLSAAGETAVERDALARENALCTTLVITALFTSQLAGWWLRFVLRRGWPLLSTNPEEKAADFSLPAPSRPLLTPEFDFPPSESRS
jgi:chromosome segregation ATPase